MRTLLALGSLALLLTPACTSVDEAKSKSKTTPKANPEAADDGQTPEEPEPKDPVAQAAIASVQMIQDCPGESDGGRPPPPPSAAAPAKSALEPTPMKSMAKPMRQAPAADMEMAPGATAEGYDGPGLRQPCTQSTMQVAFTGQGPNEAKVKISTVRMLDPDSGKEVATLTPREPAAWDGNAYQAWDEVIAPGKDVKSSYKLSVPDWSAVDSAIGTGSFGHMFILEVELTVGDEAQKVRSMPFPREEPHVIVT